MELSCVRCDKELVDLEHSEPQLHPIDGLCFSTSGHYGSTYFDPMDGTVLQIVVCDDCVRKLEDEGRAVRLQQFTRPSEWIKVERKD